MDFLGKLKNMAFTDDDPKPPAQVNGSAPPVRQPVPMGNGQTFAPALNQGMVDAIRKQTFSRNTALTALITAGDSLADVIPDPVMRLKAAQKMAGAGRSAQDIAAAVQIHLTDVDNAERQFGVALQAKMSQDVGTLSVQADSTDKQIKAMQDEVQAASDRIRQLQDSIGTATANSSQLRQQAAGKEQELRAQEDQFKAAADSVRAELNAQKTTILSTLG